MTRLPRHAPLLLAALAVLAATLLTYAGTLGFDFVAWDDGITIYQNPELRDLSLDRIAWAFTDVATTMRWIPLALLSLTITHTFHGLDPFGYHLGNWLLQGAAAVAAFLVLRELLGRAAARRDAGGRDDAWVLACAAAGALAWSLHPLRVEVVAWSNSRGHVQAGLFVLLSLLAYLRAHRLEAPPPGWWRGAVAPAALFLAALTSHPFAIGAAPLFLILDVHLGRLGGPAGWWNPATRRVLLEKLPVVAVTSAVLSLTLVVRALYPGRWPAPVPLSEWGVFPRAMGAAFAWIHYATVTLWPVGLFPAPTDLVDFDPWSGPFLLRGALVLAITAAVVLLRRRWPVAPLAWAAWLTLCFPGLGLTEHPMFACDRYTNLPTLVPAALLAGGLLRLGAEAARRRVVAVSAAALLALLGGLAHAQAATWRNSVALFEHMLPLLGEHPFRAHVFRLLGYTQQQQGNWPAALAAFQQAALLQPMDPDLRGALANALVANGRAVEAIPHLEVAVQFDRGNVMMRCILVEALRAAGRADDARAQAAIAVQLHPRAPCAP